MHCCSWSPCGAWIFGGDAEGTLHVFKHTVHTNEYTAGGGGAKIKSAALSSATNSGAVFAYPAGRAHRIIRAATQAVSPLIAMTYHPATHKLATRCEDGHIRVWTMAQLTGPGPTQSGGKAAVLTPHMAAVCENAYPQANVAFSPDGDVLCAGSATPTSAELFFWAINADASTSSSSSSSSTKAHAPGITPTLLQTVSLTESVTAAVSAGAGNDGSCEDAEGSIEEGGSSGDSGGGSGSSGGCSTRSKGGVVVLWPPKTNQVIVGLSGGDIKVFFDRGMSSRGALQPVNHKGKKARAKDYAVSAMPTRVPDHLIITPNALPMFQEVNVAIKGNTIITGAAAAAHAKEVHSCVPRSFHTRKHTQWICLLTLTLFIWKTRLPY